MPSGLSTLSPPSESSTPDPLVAPLLDGQTSMWLNEQIRPGDPAYNEVHAFRVRGPVDGGALERALADVVARHPALRTAYEQRDGEPVQRVLHHVAVRLEHARVANDDGALRALATAFACRPHDLAAGRLFRALLARIGPDDHLLVLAVHHLAADGAALSLIDDDLGRAYAARRTGEEPVFPPLLTSVTRIALERRERERSGTLEAGRRWWRRQLDGAPATSRPPVDRVRERASDGGAICVALGADVRDALRAIASEAGISLFTVLAAAWCAYLHRATGQSEVVTGVPVGNRDPQNERVVGCLINVVALRVAVDGNASFRRHVVTVAEELRAALSHRDVPFGTVVRDQRLATGRGELPLFQTAVSLRNRRLPKLGLRDCTVEQLFLPRLPAKLDAALDVRETDDGLELTFEYRLACYDDATGAARAARLTSYVAALAAEPDRALGDLPLLLPEERRALLAVAPAPAVDAADRLDALVFAAATRAPNAPAVRDARAAIDYGTLVARASRVAAGLRAAGVRPGAAVAVAVPPSVGEAVALLGVLAAGAAYVPIDANFPAPRVREIVADAGAALTIDAPMLETLLAASPAVPADRGDADDLAYLLPTSGSTGRPKLVEVAHRAIVTYLRGVVPPYGLGPDDRVLRFASLAFDTSVEEVFATLVAGAELVVPPKDARLDPDVFLRFLDEARITVIDVPTAFWRLVVDRLVADDRRLPASLRLAIIGGEAMPPAAARAWLERRTSPSRLLNSYGPTEASVAVAFADITSVAADAAIVDVGTPLPGVRADVVDARGELVPPGVVGMLRLAGPQLARGYAGDPVRTAAAFIPDPFVPGGRCYLTGDRARRRVDGRLEIYGREDGQVKVRGVRIELGEVESVLGDHPGVTAVAALVRPGVDGEGELIAYVGGTADEAALRERCAARLPAYAVPRIVRLPELPLTASGKIDRRALAAQAPAGEAPATGRIAPRTELEHEIATTFSELLGIAEIGVHDSFFALGGHSLLAARLVAALERRLGKRIRLATLFESHTVAALAEVFAAGAPAVADHVVQVRYGDGRHVPLFWFHGDVTGGGLYTARIAASLDPARGVVLIAPHGVGRDDDVPLPTIEAMADERLATVRALRPHGPYLLGGYCNGGTVAFEVARRLRAAGEDVELVVLANAPQRLRPLPAVRAAVRVAARVLRFDEDRELTAYARWHGRCQRLRQEPEAAGVARRALRRISRSAAETTDASGLLFRYGIELERYGETTHASCEPFPVLQLRSIDDRGVPLPQMDWRDRAMRVTDLPIATSHPGLVRDHAAAIGAAIETQLAALASACDADRTRNVIARA